MHIRHRVRLPEGDPGARKSPNRERRLTHCSSARSRVPIWHFAKRGLQTLRRKSIACDNGEPGCPEPANSTPCVQEHLFGYHAEAGALKHGAEHSPVGGELIQNHLDRGAALLPREANAGIDEMLQDDLAILLGQLVAQHGGPERQAPARTARATILPNTAPALVVREKSLSRSGRSAVSCSIIA